MLEPIESFGAIDAENDERLIEYFYRTEIIDELLSYRRSIVIGRKGSGKTAIYKYIKNEKKNNCTALLFKDYPWKTHDRFKNNIVSERESYVNSWTFFFFIEIFKKIIELKESISDKKKRKEVKKIEKWLKRNWGSINFDHREVMSPKKPKFNFTFSPQISGYSLGSLSKDLSEKEDMGSTLTEYNKKLEKITTGLVKDFQGEIILAFDELDLSYSPSDSNYENRLIGLLLTTYDFFNKYRKKIKVFVFLRNDIFNVLEFQDKNKIKDNMVVFLDWDSESVESLLSLKALISNRIKNNIGSNSDNFERNWNEIFEDNNIGRNQLKWNFIIERTFVRPRDLIKFMNLALNQAKARLRIQPDSIDKITNEDIHNIRALYSTYLFEELKDEVMSKYPDYNKYMEILRDVHKVTFTIDEFTASYETIKDRLEIVEDIDTVLGRLYEFSIIGFYKPGGGGYGGSEYRFQYTSDHQAFNPRASKFRVHYGFKEHLELIE